MRHHDGRVIDDLEEVDVGVDVVGGVDHLVKVTVGGEVIERMQVDVRRDSFF